MVAKTEIRILRIINTTKAERYFWAKLLLNKLQGKLNLNVPKLKPLTVYDWQHTNLTFMYMYKVFYKMLFFSSSKNISMQLHVSTMYTCTVK